LIICKFILFLSIMLVFQQIKSDKMQKPAAYVHDFFSLFYPRLCNACRRSLIKDEECICTMCHFHLPRTDFFIEKENNFSQIFWGRLPIETATALFYFQKKGKVQNLIHQLKYKGKSEIGIYLGKMLGNQLSRSIYYDPVDLIIPVPLHPAKQHKRGYNQSELIARGVSQGLNLPLSTGNLVRVTKTETQTRKSKFRRWQNVETVFQINDPKKLQNKNILLIDDVVTTGSTLEACGQKLLEIQGVKLWIATLAIAI
jgi:ComF family protein